MTTRPRPVDRRRRARRRVHRCRRLTRSCSRRCRRGPDGTVASSACGRACGPDDTGPGPAASPRRGQQRCTSRPDHGPIRTAGVIAVSRPTVSTRAAWVRGSALGHDAAVGRDHAGDAVRRGDHQPAPGLDRAQPGDRELLVDLVGVDEGRVAGLHGQQLRAAGHLGVDAVVVGDVEADRVGDLDAGDGQAGRRGCPRACRGRSRRAGRTGRVEVAAERDVLAERAPGGAWCTGPPRR